MLRTSFVIALSLGWLASGLNAAILADGDQITLSRGTPHNSTTVDGIFDTTGTYGGIDGGGEFLITPTNGSAKFKTFCLERNEYIELDRTYRVTIEDGARQGGSRGPNPDPLSHATKWLYYWYSTYDVGNDLGALGFDYDSQSSANAFQTAIWFLEHEYPIGHTLSASSLAAKMIGAAEGAGDFDVENAFVKVMNLWTTYPVTNESSQRKQSQLYFYTVEGNTGGEVPEPASIAVWSLISLAGVVAFRRRKAVQA